MIRGGKSSGGNNNGTTQYIKKNSSTMSEEGDSRGIEQQQQCRDDDESQQYLLRGTYNLKGRELLGGDYYHLDDEESLELGSVSEVVTGMTKQLTAMDSPGDSSSSMGGSSMTQYKQLRVYNKDQTPSQIGYLEVVDFGGFEDDEDDEEEEEEEEDSYPEGSSDDSEEKDAFDGIEPGEEEAGSSSSDKENSTKEVERDDESTPEHEGEYKIDAVNTTQLQQLTEKPHYVMCMSTAESSLAGLKVVDYSSNCGSGGHTEQHQQPASQDPLGSNFDRMSSLGYSSTDISASEVNLYKENDADDEKSIVAESSISSATIDLDSHLSTNDKWLGVPKLDPEDVTTHTETTPIESLVAMKYASYATTTITTTKRSAPPVVITPTENGDVIVVKPIMMVEDGRKLIATPPPNDEEEIVQEGGSEQLSTLMIPTLKGDCNRIVFEPKADEEPDDNQDAEERKVDATQIESIYVRRSFTLSNSASNEVSPTGVDELFDEEFSEVNFSTTAADATTSSLLSKKPSIPALRNDSKDFVASEGWDDGDDDDTAASYQYSSSGFGQFKSYDDALRDILKGKDNEVELSPSLETDCGQSNISVASSSAVLSSASEGLKVVKEGEETTTSRTSLGSFSQIFEQLGKISSESESESDAPGDYFDDIEKERRELEEVKEGEEEEEEVSSSDSDETPDFMKRTSNKPWANNSLADSESEDYDETDLISEPSQNDPNQQEGGLTLDVISPPNVPNMLSGEVDDAQLKSYWANEWSAMSSEKNDSAETNGSIVEKPSIPDFHCLLKCDVGNSMDDEDEDYNNAESQAAADNICRDSDGNTYLVIKDINSGDDIYTPLTSYLPHQYDTQTDQDSFAQEMLSLDTVEECATEDEKDEDEPVEVTNSSSTVEVYNVVSQAMAQSALGPFVNSDKSVASLDDLYNSFDEYQAVLPSPESSNEHEGNIQHDQVPQLSSSSSSSAQLYRNVKSTKKRHVHIRKRAIVKAKASENKTKFDLSYLEKGSHHGNNKVSHRRKVSMDSSELVKTNHARMNSDVAVMNSSFEDLMFETHAVLSGLERKETSDSDETFGDESSVGCKKQEDDTSDVFSHPDKNEDDHSVATFASLVMQEEAIEKEDIVSSCPELPPLRPPLKRGQSSMMAKLIEENQELAEVLASTQSQLEKLQRSLDMANSELELSTFEI